MTKKELKELDEDDRQYYYETRKNFATDGPQAVIHFLDNFGEDAKRTGDMAANLIFVGHLVQGMARWSFPMEKGNTSKEFQQTLAEAFQSVRQFVQGLPPEMQESLSAQIRNLCDLNEPEIAEFVLNYQAYRIRTLKHQGLYDE